MMKRLDDYYGMGGTPMTTYALLHAKQHFMSMMDIGRFTKEELLHNCQLRCDEEVMRVVTAYVNDANRTDFKEFSDVLGNDDFQRVYTVTPTLFNGKPTLRLRCKAFQPELMIEIHQIFSILLAISPIQPKLCFNRIENVKSLVEIYHQAALEQERIMTVAEYEQYLGMEAKILFTPGQLTALKKWNTVAASAIRNSEDLGYGLMTTARGYTLSTMYQGNPWLDSISILTV